MSDIERPQPQDPSTETSRLQLLWDVFLFQFKLAADGLRDVLLSPLSVISAIVGLVVGGEDPYRYFRQLLRLGRRSEAWINLFGHREDRGTSDEMVAPIKQRVISQAHGNRWIRKAGSKLNRTLDTVNDSIGSKMGSKAKSDDDG